MFALPRSLSPVTTQAKGVQSNLNLNRSRAARLRMREIHSISTTSNKNKSERCIWRSSKVNKNASHSYNVNRVCNATRLKGLLPMRRYTYPLIESLLWRKDHSRRQGALSRLQTYHDTFLDLGISPHYHQHQCHHLLDVLRLIHRRPSEKTLDQTRSPLYRRRNLRRRLRLQPLQSPSGQM